MSMERMVVPSDLYDQETIKLCRRIEGQIGVRLEEGL